MICYAEFDNDHLWFHMANKGGHHTMTNQDYFNLSLRGVSLFFFFFLSGVDKLFVKLGCL